MNQLDLDDLITQLAFGRMTPSSQSALGMHISEESVYLAEAAVKEGGKMEVRHLVRVPFSSEPAAIERDPKTPATVTGAIDKNFLAGSDAAIDILRKALSQGRWGTKNVVITLSHQVSILRYFVMPVIERRFWKTAVPLQAKKYIPIPFESLDYDFQVFASASDTREAARNGVLFGVTTKTNLQKISEFAQKLDLEVLSIETACLSALRFWEQTRKTNGANVYCCVHFDGGSIRIILIDRGLPVFFREVYLGAQATLQDQRRIDLEGCVAFAQKQLGIGNVEAVFVSGGGAVLENWRDAFGKELGVRPLICDEATPLGLKQSAWEGYAALGASVKFTVPSRAALDLGKIGKVNDDELRAARAVFISSAVMAAWFALMGIVHFVSYRLQARQIARYKVDPATHMALAGKAESDISLLLDSMHKQLMALQDIVVSPPSLALMLKDIADASPSGVWIDDLSYSNPMAGESAMASYGGTDSGSHFYLHGESQTDTLTNAQSATYKFRDNLSASPVFGKIFKQIQISLEDKSKYNTAQKQDNSVPSVMFLLDATQQRAQ